MQRFRGGLVFKAHRLGVSLNSRHGSNKEEERSIPGARAGLGSRVQDSGFRVYDLEFRVEGLWFRV